MLKGFKRKALVEYAFYLYKREHKAGNASEKKTARDEKGRRRKKEREKERVREERKRERNQKKQKRGATADSLQTKRRERRRETMDPLHAEAQDMANEAAEKEIEAPEGQTQTSRFLTCDERREATEMLMAGESIRAISRKLGRAHSSIHKVKLDLMKGKSWKEKRTKKRGSKLDDPKYKKIIEDEMWKNNGRLTIAQMAKLLQVSTTTNYFHVCVSSFLSLSLPPSLSLTHTHTLA